MAALHSLGVVRQPGLLHRQSCLSVSTASTARFVHANVMRDNSKATCIAPFVSRIPQNNLSLKLTTNHRKAGPAPAAAAQPSTDALAAALNSFGVSASVSPAVRLALPVFVAWLILKIVSWLAARAEQSIGVDLRPLLAVGGVSSLVMGLSSQNVLANIISGLTIFISSPFVVGERVTMQGGGQTLTGLVTDVKPLRTTICNDQGVPVQVPNKLVADMVILNETRIGRPSSVVRFTVSAKVAQLESTKEIVAGLTNLLIANQQVDGKKPVGVVVTKMTAEAVEMTVKCKVRKDIPGGLDLAALGLMLDASAYIKSQGAAVLSTVRA